MREKINKWASQVVILSLLVGCVLPQGQTIFQNPQKTLTQNSQTTQAPQWNGELVLEIDPSLMGDKYKNLKKIRFEDSDSNFRIQSEGKNEEHDEKYKKYKQLSMVI